ncbi:MAG TPA: hypothetical protein VJV78_49020 [Polyangiales bacterium]|nr:hypothetical protein [Polyangiales bacterium]
MQQPEQPSTAATRTPKPKQRLTDEKARNASLAQAARRFAPPPRRFLRKLAGRR